MNIAQLYATMKSSVRFCRSHFNGDPICKTTEIRANNNLPSHEPYIPDTEQAKLYNCSTQECYPLQLYSITQMSAPNQNLKHCYLQMDEYVCQKLKFQSFKGIDKLLFLSNNLPNKQFYFIDCLLYSDGARVCHRKDEADSYTKLIDIGNIIRPKEPNVLSQDEFICEQSEDNTITCDLNQYVSYNNELKLKDRIKTDTRILLKTGTFLYTLDHSCLNAWCGYTGRASVTRRMEHYEPPGGKVYRCYYANKQQVCKELYGRMRSVYNERNWLSS